MPVALRTAARHVAAIALAVWAAALVTNAPVGAQRPSRPTLTLKFSQPCELVGQRFGTTLEIVRYFGGPHDEISSDVRPRDPAAFSELQIPAESFEQSASSLNAFVWCSGYQSVIVRVPRIADAALTRDVALTPAPQVRLHGRVTFPAAVSPADHLLVASLSAFDIELLLGVDPNSGTRGFGPELYPLADAEIASDGSFTMVLPDLKGDPNFLAQGRTDFLFSIGSHPLDSPSAAADSDSPWVTISAATGYPDPLLLHLLRPASAAR